jgi:hypothetical protein
MSWNWERMPRESSLGPGITRFLTPSGSGPSMAGERLRVRWLDGHQAMPPIAGLGGGY